MQALADALKTIASLHADDLAYGNPRFAYYKESHQTSYQLVFDLPCGHDNGYMLTYLDEKIVRRRHGLTGEPVKEFTLDEAVDWFIKHERTLPAERKRFIREIEPKTLARILHGEKLFQTDHDRERESYKQLWTPKEILYAQNRPIDSTFRTFDERDNDHLTRCLCVPRSIHEARR